MPDGFQIMGYAPDFDIIVKILYAIGVWIAVLLVARAAKWGFAKLVDAIPFLQKTSGNGDSIGESMGSIVGLFIKLFGLIMILNIFGLTESIKPLEGLLTNIFDAIPAILVAGLIFFIGNIIAKIVRELIVTALSTVNFDKWAGKGGVEEVTGNSQISSIIGTVVYAMIMIIVSIAALDALGIEAISGPAIAILSTIAAAIPQILLAVLILGIAYAIARFVSKLIHDVLPGLGLDKSVAALNVLPATTSASDILSKISTTAIMIFGAIAATDALNFPALTNILDTVLALGGKILFGAIIIGAGFFIANIVSNMINGAAGTIARYGTLFVFISMGLNFMEIGGEFAAYAPLAIVVGATIAAALAFGLGGRDAAAKVLAEMQDDTPTKATKKPAAKK